MKKVFISAAVVAMMVAAVSCNCRNSKKTGAEESTTELAEEFPPVDEATGPLGETGPLN